MNLITIISLFLLSCLVLAFLSSRIIRSLDKIARYLGWREFVIAFFVIAIAGNLPNLFVDFNAALQGKPEITLGDIIGGNLVDLTIILAISTFFSRKGLSAKSEMVQKTAMFTSAIAILPLLLIWDGKMDRMDGIILIFAFLFYAWWLFAEEGRFRKVYREKNSHHMTPTGFTWAIVEVILLVILLLVSSQAVVWSAQFFATSLGVSLSLVGIIIVALGNSFPETYFSIVSARKEENWMVLGDLMGSVISCATLVLGIIVVIVPFEIKDLSLFLAARTFLIIAAAFSLLFIITNKKISKKEGLFLLFIYIAFLITQIFIK